MSGARTRGSCRRADAGQVAAPFAGEGPDHICRLRRETRPGPVGRYARGLRQRESARSLWVLPSAVSDFTAQCDKRGETAHRFFLIFADSLKAPLLLRLVAEAFEQPGPCIGPDLIGLAGRNSQQLGGLFAGQASKKAQLDQLGSLAISCRQ